MTEYYAFKYHSNDTYNKIYMDSLSGENREEYYKYMGDKFHIVIIRNTWGLVSKKYLADHPVLPVT